MDILVRFSCFFVLAGFAQARGSDTPIPEPWSRIRSLLEEATAHGNPELVNYLKSLTAEEMLTAARQSCEDAATQPGKISEEMRAGGAEMYVMVCLEYYFDKCSSEEEGARALLGAAADTAEHPWFRRAIIEGMGGGADNRFEKTFQTYVEGHQPEIDAILGQILRDQRENALLREVAMHTVAEGLRGRAVMICARDPNVRAVKERTHKIVPVGEMVRSGELTLAEETWTALRPIEKQILENAKVLGAILADEENEPEIVRGRANSMLKAYYRLPLSEQGQAEIEKALGHSNE